MDAQHDIYNFVFVVKVCCIVQMTAGLDIVANIVPPVVICCHTRPSTRYRYQICFLYDGVDDVQIEQCMHINEVCYKWTLLPYNDT